MLLLISTSIPSHSESFDDVEVSEFTNSDRVAEYLLVTLNGAGNVSFTQPVSQVVKNENGSNVVSLKIGSERVPGVGPIVAFKVSRSAKISTSDKQNMEVEAGEYVSFLLANDVYPAISFTFFN